MKQIDAKGGLHVAFGDRGRIAIPREIVPTTFKAVPKARPVVTGMPTTSLLAHLALWTDVATKHLGELPELKASVPGYLPYSEWEKVNNQPPIEENQRMETQPAAFEVTESSDGKTMVFTQARMRFVMGLKVGKLDEAGMPTQDRDHPSLTKYAELLSSRYDAIA